MQYFQYMKSRAMIKIISPRNLMHKSLIIVLK